jgi:hypothetical protein
MPWARSPMEVGFRWSPALIMGVPCPKLPTSPHSSFPRLKATTGGTTSRLIQRHPYPSRASLNPIAPAVRSLRMVIGAYCPPQLGLGTPRLHLSPAEDRLRPHTEDRVGLCRLYSQVLITRPPRRPQHRLNHTQYQL